MEEIQEITVIEFKFESDRLRKISQDFKDFYWVMEEIMGIRDWMLRKSNVGSVARSVASGWKAVLEQDPSAMPREIAETIVSVRYFSRNEVDLARSAMSGITDSITPLDFSWLLLCNDSQEELDTCIQNSEKWRQIMKEEIRKIGLNPE